MTFTAPQGTTTAIVGPSGSGKSTICNLVARFYDADSGTVSVGGHDVREFTCESLLRNISMVFQNVYLFQDSVENNIKFGCPNATHEQVVAAARAACCHDFIMSLPDGYDTVVGEGGLHPLRRRAPAHLHRPGDFEGCAHRDFGRGHSQRGPGE